MTNKRYIVIDIFHPHAVGGDDAPDPDGMGGPAVAVKGMLDVARAASVDAKLLREWMLDALSRYDYFTCEVEGEGGAMVMTPFPTSFQSSKNYRSQYL